MERILLVTRKGRKEKQKMKRRFKWMLSVSMALALSVSMTSIRADAVETSDTAKTSDAAGTSDTTQTSEAANTEQLLVAASGICVGESGTLYVTDSEANVIWQSEDGESGFQVAAGSEKTSGYLDAKALKAQFDGPWGIVAYKGGYVVSDTENNAIRLFKNGKVRTYAGKGTAGKSNKSRKKATFNRPTGLAVGDNGELYVADTGNNRIRVISDKGIVSTYVGSSAGCADGTLKKAKFDEPTGLFYANGALFVADSGNHRVCKIKNGKVTTIAGSVTGIEGDQDGERADSLLSFPQGVYVRNGKVYVADTGNGCVRQVRKGTVSTLVEAYSLQDGRAPSAPRGLAVKDGYLYIGDVFGGQVVKVKL